MHNVYTYSRVVLLLDSPQTGQHCPSGVMVPAETSSQLGSAQCTV